MRRAAVIGIVAGVVAVGALTAGAVWWLTRTESAADAASRYVQALESGNRSTLSSFLHDDADRERLLAAFDAATGHVSDVTLSAPTRQADQDGFRAEVTVGGKPGVIFFALSHASGQWRLSSDYLASIEITTTIGDTVQLGDTTVLVGRTTLLPAVYEVLASPTAVLTGHTTLAATNEAPLTVAVAASLSPDATAIAQSQLEVYAQTCAATATAIPTHCGLRVPWGADLTRLDSVSFHIDTMPRLVLSADATTFAATGGVIVATAHGASREGGDGMFTYRAEDWALRGSVSFRDGQMVLAVR